MRNIFFTMKHTYTLSALFTALFLLFMPSVLAQNGFAVMFYNVENLFDCYDEPDKNDDEYIAGGDRNWSVYRYWEKMRNVSRVVVAASGDYSPALVGLCEVENDTVLTDLTTRSPLRNIGYSYVMTSSPDKRGIDVALMYKRGFFKLIGHESLRVDLSPFSSSPTRDILHVWGRVMTGDTLDVYVCHWPSRISGVSQSEPRRMKAAAVARKSIDTVFSERLKAYVLLMGDLNEGPGDIAVRDVLRARPLSEGYLSDDTTLITLMDLLPNGSYKYQGEWDKYDQFIVSASLMNRLGCLQTGGARILHLDFLLIDDDKYGGYSPFRTYNGYRYQGGYSDHLPIVVDISY